MCETCENVKALQEAIINLAKEQIPLAMKIYDGISVEIHEPTTLAQALFAGGTGMDKYLPDTPDPLVEILVSNVWTELRTNGLVS